MIHKYRAQGIFDVISIGAHKACGPIESKLKDEPYNVKFTTCDADWHVKFVERMTQFVKERIQAVQVVMPYKTIPKRLMTIEIFHRVIIHVNPLSPKGSLHSILSPTSTVVVFWCPVISVGKLGYFFAVAFLHLLFTF